MSNFKQIFGGASDHVAEERRIGIPMQVTNRLKSIVSRSPIQANSIKYLMVVLGYEESFKMRFE